MRRFLGTDITNLPTGIANPVLTQNGTIIASGLNEYLCKPTAPCTYVAGAAIDPYASYKWVQATYANVAAAAGNISPISANPNTTTVVVAGTYAPGDYVVNSSGQLVNPAASTCGAGAGCNFVTAGAIDATASKNLTGSDIAANSGFKGWVSPTGDATTHYQGGATYSNATSGLSTATGPAGLIASDGKGNNAQVGAAGFGTFDANGNGTVVTPTAVVTGDGKGNYGGISATSIGDKN